MEPRFQEHFIDATGLPNRIEPFPHLSAAVTMRVGVRTEANLRRRGRRV
jgi:uncharacterized 2Fe-2S/4Fe-4S cluster protein (DUF4445 family)